MPLLISAGMPTLPFVSCIKEVNPGTAGRNPFESGPLTACWDGLEHIRPVAASGLQQPRRLISAAVQADGLYPKALTNNIKLGFPLPILTVKDDLSENRYQCPGYSHVPMPCFFIHYKMPLSLLREFPPYLLREDKISNLQMQVLGNPRFPEVSLHLSKKTVNVTRKRKSQIYT